MSRLNTVERDSLPENQRRFHDAVKAIRRRPITGPFMKPFLRTQLDRYEERLQDLERLLSSPDIMSDMAQFLLLSREHTEVGAVASRWPYFCL